MPDAASNRKPTFVQWIRRHGVALRGGLAGGGHIGRFARWIAEDPCWPARCRTVDGALAHLAGHEASAGLPDEITLRSLFQRYRAFLAAGGTLPKATPRPMVHRGYLIPGATEAQILELKQVRSARTGRRVTLGDVIATEIAKAHRRECRDLPKRGNGG